MLHISLSPSNTHFAKLCNIFIYYFCIADVAWFYLVLFFGQQKWIFKFMFVKLRIYSNQSFGDLHFYYIFDRTANDFLQSVRLRKLSSEPSVEAIHNICIFSIFYSTNGKVNVSCIDSLAIRLMIGQMLINNLFPKADGKIGLITWQAPIS